MEDQLKVEWDKTNVYLMLGGSEMQLSRVEAEGLFVTLGNALQDQDKMKEEANAGKSK